MNLQTFVDSTNACLEAFQKLVSSPGLGDETLQQQLARFNYWAANIGVFAPSRASLDTRLSHKNNTNYRRLLLQLLDVLERNLHAAANGPAPGTDVDNTNGISHKDTIQAVSDIISSLHRLSATIRRSAARDRNPKAANFVERDDEGKDISTVFQENVTRIIQQRYPDASKAVCERLGESVTLRRRRVLYSRRHQAKLAIRPQVRKVLPAVVPHIIPQTFLPITLDHTPIPQPSPEPAPIAMSVRPSETAASVPDSDTQGSTIALSRASSASTGSMIQDQSLRYPPAPKVDARTGEASCPYCAAVLTKDEVFNTKFWRRHLKRDTEPFVCTAESCKGQIQFFVNFKLWLKHIQQEHRMQWHCTIATHRPIVFSDREEFESHMLKELKGKINNSQLATLVRRGAQPAAHAFDECPLCKAQPDDINTKDHLTHDLTINDPLPRHVAGHLKTLALMFLPPGDNPEEDETDGPGSSSTKKSSRSVDADSIFKSSLTFDDDVSSKEDHDYTEWIFLPREPYGGHIQDPTLDMFVSRQVDIDMEHAHLSEVERENFKEYKTNTTQGTKTMLEDELSCAIKDDFAEVQTGVADVQVGVAEWRVAHKDTDHEKVLNWLSTSDASTNHDRARIKHEPTTGEWFIYSEQFSSWWNNASQVLWLHAIPGCGKTVLCSTIIERVKALRSNTSDVGYAYFYFDFNDERKQTTEGFLRSTIVHLSNQCPSLPEEVRNLYEANAKQQHSPGRSDLLETLISLVRRFRRTYLIMDALDECSEREAMFDLIAQMVAMDQKLGEINILITSRRERDIETTLQELVTDSICIQSAQIDADIKLHVRSRLSHDSKLKRHPDPVKTQIEKTLVNGADGMFRWVDCQLDSLRTCLSAAALRKALKALPKGLDATYDRILCNIEEDYRTEARTALQWLAFSARPLELKEVAEVVAVRTGCGLEFVDDRLFDPHEILTICSSLISISEGSSEVRLAHYSVKEYLTSERILSGSASAFAAFEVPANRNITEHCLTYLSLFDAPDSLSESCLEDFPLLDYAARYWYHHARILDQRNEIDILVQFLDYTRSSAFSNWLRIYQPDIHEAPSVTEASEDQGSPLYYVSCCGLFNTAVHLIDDGADVNAPGGEYGNALQAAVSSDDEAIVKLLLASGADVNAQGGYYGNALQAAATHQDNKAIVKLLLASGADVSAQGGYYGNALQAATEAGDEAIVKLLLASGADVNAQGGYYGNALQAAAAHQDNEAIVKLLLASGADVNAQGGLYGNALQAAAKAGREEIFEVLLQNGAVVTQEGDFDTPWDAASYGARKADERWMQDDNRRKT